MICCIYYISHSYRPWCGESKNTCLDDDRADIDPRDDVVNVGIRKAPGACTSGETSCHTLEQEPIPYSI
jgi:hypothetical protein